MVNFVEAYTLAFNFLVWAGDIYKNCIDVVGKRKPSVRVLKGFYKGSVIQGYLYGRCFAVAEAKLLELNA